MTEKTEILNIWKLEIADRLLDDSQRSYLTNLPLNRPDVSWIWEEMDRVWNSQGLDNKSGLHNQDISAYYMHPVWLANGIFIATDPVSIIHREEISDYIFQYKPVRVADYGGGTGILAKMIAKKDHQTHIDVIEPFPNSVAIKMTEAYGNISFISDFNGTYDVIIAQDVLEHVEDPIGLAIKMVNATNTNGLLIFANCFYPVIHCHLPKTFFLRHTFKYVIKGLGLQYIGVIAHAQHALVFRKVGELDAAHCRKREAFAKVFGPYLNALFSAASQTLKKIGVR